ncbi:efflux RND transporter periplasmic adaptor subunit [Pseudomonas asuensis]|uniref:Resistance-nodulation-cell division (RND) efflux membrane fusion protein n=1 Tax=Pseudomonas asuensis TaxID=1825787 RepID=A0ABQ2GS67_9PSED|nr:efflux RND transporter periplasmic adaptor subunit [Pseudomonas asuensis]GGM08480.1 resistance-nodulation-cell division (RND) efflux membrane fusion protein [Pseudomonas asuensis]
MSRVRFLLLGLVTLLAACSDKQEPPPPVRPVLFVEAKPQQVRSLGAFTGHIQARYESTLSFRVGGRIAQRKADVGDLVKKGTLLAALDPTDQQNAYRSSEGDLAQAQAQWMDAEANARRQQALYAKGVGSKAQLDQVMAQLHTARAARDRAQAARDQSHNQLSYSELYTDFDGVITAWHAETGQVVSPGEQVVTLARPEVKEAVVDVPAGLAETLPADTTFTVTSQLDPSVSTTGHIRELAPQADAMTRTRRVRLTLGTLPPAFRLGSLVTVALTNDTPRELTELPASALLDEGGKTSVWIVDPESRRVSLREVHVLAREERTITVDSGLKAGERVVTAGVHSLKPGQDVKMDVEQR